jgi:hypothetical protein
MEETFRKSPPYWPLASAKGGPGQTSENQPQYAAELYAEVLEALTRDRTKRMRRHSKTPAQPSEPRKSADPFYRKSGEG